VCRDSTHPVRLFYSLILVVKITSLQRIESDQQADLAPYFDHLIIQLKSFRTITGDFSDSGQVEAVSKVKLRKENDG